MIRKPVVAVALAVALMLAACGDSADDSSTTMADPVTTETPDSEAPASTAPADAPRAQDGDTVKVHYTGMLEDGEVFDSSDGRDPLEFVVASGQVIPGFDDAVRGLAVGEARTQRIEPANGYGESDPELVIEFPLEQLPEGTVAGDSLFSSNGQEVVVVSIDEAAGTALIDTNHFLAGKVLVFDVELVELIPAG